MAFILVLDDDVTIARLLGEIVEFTGHRPVVETDALDAVTRHADVQFGAVLTDLMMPRLDGIEVLTIFADRSPDTRRILVTAAPEEKVVREALRQGIVQQVIVKPPAISDVKLALAWL